MLFAGPSSARIATDETQASVVDGFTDLGIHSRLVGDTADDNVPWFDDGCLQSDAVSIIVTLMDMQTNAMAPFTHESRERGGRCSRDRGCNASLLACIADVRCAESRCGAKRDQCADKLELRSETILILLAQNSPSVRREARRPRCDWRVWSVLAIGRLSPPV